MRQRSVGGYEPDDGEQAELVQLWHTSRTACTGNASVRAALLNRFGSERAARLHWTTEQFCKANDGKPNVASKWVYVWLEANTRLAAGTTPPVNTLRSVSQISSPIETVLDRVQRREFERFDGEPTGVHKTK